MRASEYCFLNEQPLVGEDLEVWLKSYKELLESSLEKYIPVANELYQQIKPLLQMLCEYKNDLLAAIKQAFPANDGWEVALENEPFELKWARFAINHSTWNKKIAIYIEAQNPWLSQLFIGIRRWRWSQGYGGYNGYDETIFELCKKEFSETADNCKNGGWWVFYHNAAPLNSLTIEGSLIDPKCRFILDTTEKRQEMINVVVERLTRFKKLLPELEQLAANAE